MSTYLFANAFENTKTEYIDMKKILVTDVAFPTKLSLWRICEITSFIKDKNADILVFKIDEFAGVKYTIDYEEMINTQGYSGYNILIFDQKYNYLNKYNMYIDGTVWNGLFPASYLFTKSHSFIIDKYDIVYHIFLHCYREFNRLNDYPKTKQAIHLYPGGGFSHESDLLDISNDTKVISTNPKSTTALIKAGLDNYIECFGGTFFTKRAIYPFKEKVNWKRELTVAFASLGHSIEKGANVYNEVVTKYKSAYPSSSVTFIAIGNYPFEESITLYEPMPMMDLMTFYKENVDILISIDTGVAFNGWPLGIEAALTGVLVATTDPNMVNHSYNIPNESLFIFDINSPSEVVSMIKNMDDDRALVHERGKKCREFFSNICGYENQQEAIFSYLSV